MEIEHRGECTYITALYNIQTPDTRDHAGLQKRIDLLEKLFLLNIRIIAFMDPEYRDLIQENKYPNVKIIYREIETFQIWKMCHENKLELPNSRNTGKDTLGFLTLMNMKIEFVREGLEYCTTPIIGWIDGSIYHIVHNEENVKRVLEKEARVGNRIKIPGPIKISEHETPIIVLANQIQWKFCGGIFQGHREKIEEFYTTSMEHLERWIERGHITWEVNVWIGIAYENKEMFEWVYGDHNDSMLMLNDM